MTLNCNGRLVDLKTPKVMGIVNATPDSFYDGGSLKNEKALLLKVEQMISEGTTFLDVGGYSSRPGASDIPESEELKRVLPTLQTILRHFPEALISIDTFRSAVAEKVIEAGAVMVNDISAGHLDKHMMALVSKKQVPYILMHMRGTPQTMVNHTEYGNVTMDVLRYFSEKLNEARSHGINDLIVDPGFGFAKTASQSFELLAHLELFKSLEVPVLVGLSRKSMIYKTLKSSPEAALNGTTALHSIALLKGANILRVHDVKEALECITLMENFKI